MIKKLHFCEKCRNLVEHVEDIHYVEENSDRGFCSDECILEFYKPYMIEFEKEEVRLRNQLHLSQEETNNEIVGNEHYLNTALTNPTEVWLAQTEVGQNFYTHILELNDTGTKVYFILICSYVEGAPSFVFYRTSTVSEELAEKYRRDNQIHLDEIEQNSYSIAGEDLKIPTDVIEKIELKKSMLLAEMLDSRKESDISFEEFMSYDPYLEETLESPDEIFEFEDDEGDTLNSFIKSFKLGDLSFFYVAIVYPYSISEDMMEVTLLPIIGFPSIDNDLYPKYSKGKRVNEVLKS